MEEQFKILVYKFWCEIFSEEELHTWMKNEMDKNESPHPDFFELNAKEPYETRDILLKLAKEQFNFNPISLEGVRIGKKVFLEFGEAYLNRTITPGQLNTVINKFDSAYGPFEDDVIHKACAVGEGDWSPTFWGDLWNCFDGMWDQKITYENSSHIDEELKLCLFRLRG